MGGNLGGLEDGCPQSLRWGTARGHVLTIFGKHCKHIGKNVYTLHILTDKVRKVRFKWWNY